MYAQVEFGLYDKKQCISIILDNEEEVNECMQILIEKSFIVNHEPRYAGLCYEGSISGKKAKPTSPAAEQTSEATIHILYPILSTYLAQNRSTKSWVKKKNVDIKAILPSEI